MHESMCVMYTAWTGPLPAPEQGPSCGGSGLVSAARGWPAECGECPGQCRAGALALDLHKVRRGQLGTGGLHYGVVIPAPPGDWYPARSGGLKWHRHEVKSQQM